MCILNNITNAAFQNLHYQWFETCCINVGSQVKLISWNLEGMLQWYDVSV